MLDARSTTVTTSVRMNKRLPSILTTLRSKVGPHNYTECRRDTNYFVQPHTFALRCKTNLSSPSPWTQLAHKESRREKSHEEDPYRWSRMQREAYKPQPLSPEAVGVKTQLTLPTSTLPMFCGRRCKPIRHLWMLSVCAYRRITNKSESYQKPNVSHVSQTSQSLQ